MMSKPRVWMHRVAALFVACAAACGAPEGPVTSSSSAIDSCTRTEDCVAVAGNPCNPCGACPGEAVTIMTRAHFDDVMKNQSYCPARDYGDATKPRPACSPCPASSSANATPTPVCHAGSCVAGS